MPPGLAVRPVVEGLARVAGHQTIRGEAAPAPLPTQPAPVVVDRVPAVASRESSHTSHLLVGSLSTAVARSIFFRSDGITMVSSIVPAPTRSEYVQGQCWPS